MGDGKEILYCFLHFPDRQKNILDDDDVSPITDEGPKISVFYILKAGK